MPGNEATVGVYDIPGYKSARTIEVTTLIAGVPTVVEMQVIAIADGNGNVIDDFAGYRFQAAILAELQQIRELLGRVHGQATFIS